MEKISDKLHSIIILLEKDDIKKLRLELKSHKNKKLDKLLKIMLDSLEKEITKEQAYKKIYEKEYKKEDDFLLRNECRLLYNIIKEYFIEKEILLDRQQDELFSEYYFLKAIYQKKDKSLFNKEFQGILNEAIRKFEYIKAFQLCDLHFVATGVQQIQNFPNIKNAVEVLDIQKKVLADLFALKNTILGTRLINMHTILSVKDREALNLEIPKAIEFNLDDHNSELISYYKSITSSLLEKDISKKISLMEVAYEYIKRVSEINKEFLRERDYCQINIASYYYINQNYTKAEVLFKSFYDTKPIPNDYTLTSIVNYGNCLLQLDKYTEILDLIVKYKPELDSNQRIIFYINALLCNVYLITENVDRLRKQIPMSFQDLPDPFVFHYRFCLCILYFLEGDLESAIRESRNLGDTILYKKVYKEHYFIAKLFNKYFDKYDKRTAVDFKKYTKQFLAELDEFENDCSYNFKIFTPSKWLRKKLTSHQLLK